MRAAAPILLLVLAACGGHEQRPEGLLDRSTFTLVLAEAHLVEARMNHEVTVEHLQEVPVQEYYQEVFDAFGTDREQFTRTFQYYSAMPDSLKAVYEEVLDELGRRKDIPVDVQMEVPEGDPSTEPQVNEVDTAGAR
jgi:hypothetical protein